MKTAIYLESPAEREWAKATCSKKGWEVVDQFDAWTDPEALGYLVADAKAGRFQIVVSQTGTYIDRKTDKPVPLADALAGTGVKVHSKRAAPPRKPKPTPELPPESQARVAARAAEIRAREEEQARVKRIQEQALAELEAERLGSLKRPALDRKTKPTKAELEYFRQLEQKDLEENAHQWPCPHCGTIAYFGFGKRYNIHHELKCKECRQIFTPAEIRTARAIAEQDAYRRARAAAENQEAKEAAHRDAFGNWTR